MNVFVLCTGRCGSVTFIKACGHITNYSAGHETRNTLIGAARFAYPPDHIEADNRLSWFLGSLDRAFGDEALYVHLRRSDADTARSFLKRWTFGIMKAYRTEIATAPTDAERLAVCLDYCQTVNDNIEAFLKDKTKTLVVTLENIREDFPAFWSMIGAEGDLAAALAEWNTAYNKSEALPAPAASGNRYWRKATRMMRTLPDFIGIRR